LRKAFPSAANFYQVRVTSDTTRADSQAVTVTEELYHYVI
jgi:hypothetical protein